VVNERGSIGSASGASAPNTNERRWRGGGDELIVYRDDLLVGWLEIPDGLIWFLMIVILWFSIPILSHEYGY
jgi:hypothetical protein